MNPLNTFPALLDFLRLSPLLLRIVIGIFIFSLGYDRRKKSYSFLSALYFICGVTLIFGFYTQISSLVGIALLKLDFYFDYWKSRKTIPVPRNYYMLYVIAVVVLLSLLFTGAGAKALDMPF